VVAIVDEVGIEPAVAAVLVARRSVSAKYPLTGTGANPWPTLARRRTRLCGCLRNYGNEVQQVLKAGHGRSDGSLL
jgi:hypothetical protein